MKTRKELVVEAEAGYGERILGVASTSATAWPAPP